MIVVMSTMMATSVAIVMAILMPIVVCRLVVVVVAVPGDPTRVVIVVTGVMPIVVRPGSARWVISSRGTSRTIRHLAAVSVAVWIANV